MFYRVLIDLAFTQSDPIDDIVDKVKDHLDHAVIINEGEENEEKGYISVEKCYHDEDPSRPCEVFGLWTVPYPP